MKNNKIYTICPHRSHLTRLVFKNQTRASNTLATKSSLALVHTSSLTPAPLHPWFITGFADGDGCFFVSIQKNSILKTGWLVRAAFQIALHSKDRALLEKYKQV